ncbi:MAG: hypothetical protein WA091_00950 [Minisyncoccales bacterium]
MQEKFEVILIIINFIKIHPTVLIWIIFTFIFFFMSYKEKTKAKENLKSLEKLESKAIPGIEIQVTTKGIDFDEMLKIFKDELNKTNKESHEIASTSYFWAGVTALASIITSLL